MVTAKQAAEARAALAKKTAAKTPPRRRRPQPEETSPTKAAAVAPASGGCASGFARFLQWLLQLASFAAVGGAAYFVYADGGLRVLRLAPEESEEQADVCRVPAQFDMQGTPTWYITGCAWAWAYPGAAALLALTSVWLLCKPPNTTALYMTALLASSNAFIA